MKKYQHNQNIGATLIEVMIAVLILGIALLGVASLQVTSLQGSSNAQSRAKATDLASSLADRIRANLSGDNDYLDETASCDTMPTPAPARCAMAPDAINKTGVTECTTAEMVTYDLWELRCVNGVRDTLPGGTLVVTCTDNNTDDTDSCSDGSPFHITITWQTQLSTENMVMTFTPGS